MIKILNSYTGKLIKEIDADSLRGADLTDADLRGADLRDADKEELSRIVPSMREVKWAEESMIQINLTGIAACLTDDAGGDLRELEEQLKSLLLAHSNLRLFEVEFVQED